MSTHLSYHDPHHHLKHGTLIEMGKRVQVSQWCEKKFGQPWHSLENPDGRWTMVWGGRNGKFKNLTNFDKYKVLFADEQDLFMFNLTCP